MTLFRLWAMDHLTAFDSETYKDKQTFVVTDWKRIGDYFLFYLDREKRYWLFLQPSKRKDDFFLVLEPVPNPKEKLAFLSDVLEEKL